MCQLDVLRAVAILLVLGRHPVVDPKDAGFLRWPATLWFNFGWTGVDLFFVLSGFLVGGLLLGELHKSGRLDVGRFIIRRALKIWPAYYTLVLGSLVLKGRVGGWGWATRLYLPYLLNVQNYSSNAPFVLNQTWSLAIEEHFYLALPFLLLVLISFGRHRNAVRAVPFIAVFVMVLCTLARFFLNWHRPFNLLTHYYPTQLRIDGLAMGVLLAYLHHYRPTVLSRIARRRSLLLLIGAVLVSPMLFLDLENRFVWTIGYNMLYIGYACILVAFVHTPVGIEGGMLGRFFAGPVSRALAAVGLFSYSIYLWHLTLSQAAVRWLEGHVTYLNSFPEADWLFWTSVYVSISILVGVEMGKLIELPALALRDRLLPSRATALGNRALASVQPLPASNAAQLRSAA